MHDAPKRFNELEGDFKKSSIGEYANRGEAADQINQTASNAGERPIACIIQVILSGVQCEQASLSWFPDDCCQPLRQFRSSLSGPRLLHLGDSLRRSRAHAKHVARTTDRQDQLGANQRLSILQFVGTLQLPGKPMSQNIDGKWQT